MKKHSLKIRRTLATVVVLAAIATGIVTNADFYQPIMPTTQTGSQAEGEALTVLNTLSVKGRAPQTNYSRQQFGGGWDSQRGCDTRNIILHRDLTNVSVNGKCQVVSGLLNDPYTGKMIEFRRGETSSQEVQIDHVIALGNAWQTGAQQLTYEQREALANDPLELLAVDGPANQEKSAGDAATWLPPNKAFRCQYVARQIAVKKKYDLWVTAAEKDAIIRVLERCPGQLLPQNK